MAENIKKGGEGHEPLQKKNGKEQRAVGLIETIHSILSKVDATKKAIRSTIHRAQLFEIAYPLEVMSITANKRG